MRWTGVNILIAIRLFFVQHALLLQALLVHLVGNGEILVIIVVVRGIVVPPIPKPGIVAPSPPWIAPTPAASPTITVVAQDEAGSAVPETIPIPEPITAEAVVKSIVQVGRTRETAARGAIE